MYKRVDKKKPCEKEDCTAYCIPCKKCGLHVAEYELCKATKFVANYIKAGSMAKCKK